MRMMTALTPKERAHAFNRALEAIEDGVGRRTSADLVEMSWALREAQVILQEFLPYLEGRTAEQVRKWLEAR